jgi:hypothetical protein
MTGYTDRPIDLGVPVPRTPFTHAELIRRVEEAPAASKQAHAALRVSIASGAATQAAGEAIRSDLKSAVEAARGAAKQARRSRAEWRMRPDAAPAGPVVLVAASGAAARGAAGRFLSGRGFRVFQAAEASEAAGIPTMALPQCGEPDLDALLGALWRLLGG